MPVGLETRGPLIEEINPRDAVAATVIMGGGGVLAVPPVAVAALMTNLR